MATDEQKSAPKDFKRVWISHLQQGRRGKHHDAVMPIINEIEGLADGEAIVIPLDAMQIPLRNLRSALMKAAATRKLRVSTYSDDDSLYVWRKTAGSLRYERSPRRKTASALRLMPAAGSNPKRRS